MQKSWLLVSIMCSVLVLAFATPVLAAEKPVEIKYQFAGTIYDERNNMTGTFALALSGHFRETVPDMKTETSGEFTYGPISYNNSWTEYVTMNETQYKIDYFVAHYEFRSESFRYTLEKWYAQESYNGKLFVIWADGSISTFTVNLNPVEIVRFSYQSSIINQYHDEFRSTMYQLDPQTGNWTLVEEKHSRYGNWEWRTISREGFGIAFTGEIKGKNGRQNGLLILEDDQVTETASGYRYWDDFTENFDYTIAYREFIAMGKFGPYLLMAYRRV